MNEKKRKNMEITGFEPVTLSLRRTRDTPTPSPQYKNISFSVI